MNPLNPRAPTPKGFVEFVRYGWCGCSIPQHTATTAPIDGGWQCRDSAWCIKAALRHA